jgi:hypothetical protein
LVPLTSRGPRPDGRGEAPTEKREARTATLTELRTSSLFFFFLAVVEREGVRREEREEGKRGFGVGEKRFRGRG